MRKKGDNMEKAYKWAFLVYPDSAPYEWKKILKETQIKIAISPLHQPSEGKGEDKIHYHVICDFEGQKTQSQVNKLSKSVNGTNAFTLISPIGYYEYLIHKNDIDKEQFPEGFKAIEHMNGFDVETFQQVEKKDKLEEYSYILIEVIREENIFEFGRLVDYCYENDMELLKELRKHSYFYNSYIRSRRGQNK